VWGKMGVIGLIFGSRVDPGVPGLGGGLTQADPGPLMNGPGLRHGLTWASSWTDPRAMTDMGSLCKPELLWAAETLSGMVAWPGLGFCKAPSRHHTTWEVLSGGKCRQTVALTQW
jgi:hypothetical protein